LYIVEKIRIFLRIVEFIANKQNILSWRILYLYLPGWKRQPGRLRCRWEVNIKIDLGDLGSDVSELSWIRIESSVGLY
jgi:hypothetical protein